MNQVDLNGPVCIDRDRMDRALATPTFTLPSGLTGGQIVAVLNIISQTSRLAANAEREACLDLCNRLASVADSDGEALGAELCAAAIRARKDSA